MNRISFKGVAIGNIVDIVSTNVVVLPLAVYVLFSAGSPPDIAAGSAEEILKGSTLLVASSSILGGLCSVLGGYVSARIAKHDEVLNGALSSILCVGSGVYTVINLGSAGPLWLHLAFLPLSPALGALGAQGRDRTTDTAIFSRMLYQLSYLGTARRKRRERRFIVRLACPVHLASPACPA